MVQFAKQLLGMMITGALVSPTVWAADTAVVNFSAQISDGSCEIQLSQDTLQFGIYKAVDFQTSTAVAILPLTAAVTCSGATTPKLTVTGTTPYASGTIFRDADSVAAGAGFMVRRDTGNIDLGNFYNEAAAINNNASVSLSPVSTADAPQNEPFLLGLVRAGSETITPGAIKATLTFTVSFD
ncbi:fimbrial protein [Yersinia intermedia]|uniref:fimbrial protein n=1 Tax=Yersinia intermedia TaxID=631 RepID=UPI0022FDC186|nr:fimbrial protein [Yersinia intermedia]MDA5494135.1 fimbrial protein [Yersinia intermedia]